MQCKCDLGVQYNIGTISGGGRDSTRKRNELYRAHVRFLPKLFIIRIDQRRFIVCAGIGYLLTYSTRHL